MRKNYTSYHGITKSDLLGIFLDHILNRKALERFIALKQAHGYADYQQKAGQYIFDLIERYFTPNIRVTGLDHLRRHTPCLVAYPHKASILDGTLLNVLLLKEGINSKALARVSTDGEKDSVRDNAYKMLSDFIIPLKQEKTEDGYQPITCKDMLNALRNVYAHYKNDGVVLIAPEGKTNPHYMKKAKESLSGLSRKGCVPIVPCTVEYHEPLPGESMAHHGGGVYRYITIEFHEAVWADPSAQDDAGTLKSVMGDIASGYACRFKGGCYQPQPEDEPLPAGIWSDHLDRLNEKFDPIYRYVQSTDEKPDQKQALLHQLLTREFDISPAVADLGASQRGVPEAALPSADGIKDEIRRIMVQNIALQETGFRLPALMANLAAKAAGPAAASARY